LTRSSLLRLALPLALAAVATAQSTLVDAMSQELARNFQALKSKADPAPYFLSYEITQEDVYNISGTLGAIDSNAGGKSRTLDVSVRVGSPKLDNYHRVRGAGGGAAQFTSGAQITYEDSANSIKRRLWEETDRAYRAAAERLIRIQTNTQVKVAEQDSSADFSTVSSVSAAGLSDGTTTSTASTKHRATINAVKSRNGVRPSLQMVAFRPFCRTEAKAFARKREVMCMGLVWVSNTTRFRR